MKYQIGELCNILNGFAFKSSKYVDQGIRIIRIANVQKGAIEDSSPCFYPLDSAEELTPYMLEADDLLMSLTGNVGRVALLDIELLPAALNQRVACLRVKDSSVVAKEYLFHLLNSSYFESKCVEASNGIAQKNLSTRWLSSFEVPLCDIEEQKHRTKILNEIRYIEANAVQTIIRLDELVKSRFVEMFGDPIENPNHLPLMRIDEIADVQTGATPLRSNAAYYGGSIPWVKTGEVATGLFEEAEETITEIALQETNCKLFPAGTILVAMYGQGDTRGKAAILRQAAATNQACAAILLNEGHDADFILAQLNLRYEDLRSQSLGGNQKNLSLKIIKAYELVIPPIEQQKAFMAFVQQVDKLKFETQQAIDKLQLLYDSLAQEYFGGE